MFSTRRSNRHILTIVAMGTLWGSALSLHPTISKAQASPIFATQATSANREYQGDILTTIQTLNDFWGRVFAAEFHLQYTPVRGLKAYSPDAGVEGIPCGGERASAMNAFYCRENDLIQWDEALLVTFYEKVGDFAAVFAIAHEWGHAMQARLGLLNGRSASIQIELQADCFAGAWARYVEDLGILEKGDIDEAILGLFAVRDPVGTPWLQPGAHGTGQQRILALSHGQEGGVQRCFGDAPRHVSER